MVCLIAAKHLTHHANQLQRTRVTNPIVNPVGILACEQHTLVAKNGEMLGDVALRGTYRLHDLLYAGILVADHTKDLQAQGMRYRLQRTCRLLDMFLLVNDTGSDGHNTRASSFII